MKLQIFTGESGGSPTTSQPKPGHAEEEMLGQFIPLHYHFAMFQDEVRIEAFREAIRLHVRPGMNVLELGGGTGVLSYFAAKQGANVWCVERNPEMVQTARRLIKQNGVDDSVDVVQADAMKFLPPERVDVVVCEMLHVALLREKQLQVIESFKQRYVAEFGAELPKFVPDSTLLTVQPVQQDFDFGGYHAPVPMFQAPGAPNEGTESLGDLTPYASIFYDQDFSKSCTWSDTIPITQPGTVNALRFVTHNLVAVDADQGTVVPWSNQFLVMPIDTPQQVAAGARLRISFEYQSGDQLNVLADSLNVVKDGGSQLPAAA